MTTKKKNINNNRRSRKYNCVFNNTDKHKNCSHQAIKEKLSNWENIIYWCMCDEIAKTPHTHYLYNLRILSTFQALRKPFHLPT